MKTCLNLVSPEFQLTQLVRRRVRQWLVVLVVATIGIIVVARDKWRHCQAAADQRASLAVTYESTRNVENSKTSLEEQIELLTAEQDLAKSFAEPHPEITAIGCVSQAAKNTRGEVFVREFTMTRTPRRANSDGEAADPIPNTMTLKGAGLNGVAVAHFVAWIRDSNLFNRVHLESTEKAWTGTHHIYPFKVTCTF